MPQVDINQTMINIVTGLAVLAGGLAALAALYGGVALMTAGDDPAQERLAKKALTLAVLGFVVVVGAVAFSNILTTAVVHKPATQQQAPAAGQGRGNGQGQQNAGGGAQNGQ